jgi:hypothetical protein
MGKQVAGKIHTFQPNYSRAPSYESIQELWDMKRQQATLFPLYAYVMLRTCKYNDV